jgi:hypothetical protein
MAAVPAAETLDGHKDRFDLGVFVGDLALDEEVTRYYDRQLSFLGLRRVLLSLSFYHCNSKVCAASSLPVTTSPWRGCSRSLTTARMTRCRVLLQLIIYDICIVLDSQLTPY